ncbi:TetR/AcrR family transcriptional regulator [Nocardia nova]|uniref:Putative transcriptional regulator, TetR family n=1 Tax=Nocardia nova SH22a TaxID=1415166 RepID=W5THG4_9NOCA|nr:TetR/AcrR family transcriptional regulator [Nocardia nova]AHH18408.1 putative transcriptional regulator, TetR family [Nocardia nova SH22a]
MSVSSPGRLYGGATAEQRIAERRRKLVEAGVTLFGSHESGSVRVKDVAAEAGLTERYFYESFSDLGALFDVVLERVLAEIEAQVDAALVDAPDDTPARISIALRTVVESLATDANKTQILLVEGFGKGGRVDPQRHELNDRWMADFLRWSGPDRQPFRGGAVEARMKALALSGAATELMISWSEGLLDVSTDELADFLVGLYWRANLP